MQSLLCSALNQISKLDRKDEAKLKQIERREIEEKVDMELADERKMKKRKKRAQRRRKAEEEKARAEAAGQMQGVEKYKPCNH